MNTHYTYYILGIAENIWKDRWYIGSRTATHGRTPEEDIGIHYFTTSSNRDFVAQFKAHPEWFVCTILERGYPDVRTMHDDETRRIKESWNVLGRINRTPDVILFERDERYQETMRKMYESPEWREKNAAGNRKRSQDPVWRANHAAAMRKNAQDPVHQETRRKMHATPEWREKNAAANRKLRESPEWREKNAAANRKLCESPEWRANHAAALRKMHESPEWKAKNAAALRKMHESPEWRETMRKTYESPEWRANHAAAIHKRSQDPEFRKKISEGIKRARAARVTALFS